jgi:PhzF family phenazine biosynthesis protein
MTRPFQLVDVFGQDNFSGNPLAVVADADGLDVMTMLHITRWLNLSETAFLCTPASVEADYRVRIFTLERELPFAGHPTLGSCHAWLTAGGTPKHSGEIVQECGAGLVPVRRETGRLAFAAPPLIRSGPVEEAAIQEAAQLLRIARSEIQDAQWVDNGPGWLAVMLRSAEAVLALEPARDHPRPIDIGVVGAHPPGGDAAYELRALFRDQHGAIREDPVTGSLNASVAQWLYASGRVSTSYVAAQGTRLGRSGRVYVDRDPFGQVWIGGATRTLFSGEAVI